MIAQDTFSQYYAQCLDATYDVVDRIVLNGYFLPGQAGGGFRWWWQQLYGSDDNLDNTHLMRLAGRFSRRVRGWARKHGIPIMDCTVGDRKHDLAQRFMPTDPDRWGIFAVLVGRCPAPVWEVQRFPNGGFHLQRKKPMPWVNHYSFHIIDGQWGHVTIKICGHAPFSAQIMLNGHEYTACQARRNRIKFVKEGNCFTNVSNAAGLAKVADTLRSQTAVGRLKSVCERWIYRCLCFGLGFDEQRRTGFGYSYSVYQVEYSRNLLFARGAEMDQVFNGVIDRTRAPLNIKTLKTAFGYKHRPWRKAKPLRFEAAVEKPAYDLTVFKVHFGRLTLKVYTKGERVLRIEAVAHNSADLRCGRIIERFPEMTAELAKLLERFMEILHGVDAAFIANNVLDELPTPSKIGNTKIGGVDLNKPRMRAVFEAVLTLMPMPNGFSRAQLADRVREILGSDYTPRQATYDLKKLRAKNLIRRVARSRRYETTSSGLPTITGLIVLREKVIKPVLAGAGRPRLGRPPKHRNPIDEHYRCLQRQMRSLLKELRIAA
jgi:hypothetical protein